MENDDTSDDAASADSFTIKGPATTASGAPRKQRLAVEELPDELLDQIAASTMSARFEQDLIQAMGEVVEFAQGKTEPAQVHFVYGVDPREVRRKLGLSQVEFAETYRIPLATVEQWEQLRRFPDAPAAAYLLAISQQPDLIKDAVRAEP